MTDISSSTKTSFSHISVMPQEVMEFMDLKAGSIAVDVTAGRGGHLELIAQAVGPQGRVIGVDRDLRALKEDAAGGIALKYPHVSVTHSPFSQLKEVLAQKGVTQVDAILCDLGVSSYQLDTAERGFSFQREGVLDMRMDQSKGITAFELLAKTDETSLANILYEYGDERLSRRIAKAIKQAWPLENSTLALAELIEKTIRRTGKTHPATKTFQALRIAVNRELDELENLLALLPEILAPQGRAVFISFHSLEDRKIKQTFKAMAQKDEQGIAHWRIITKKTVMPKRSEVLSNRRARSAKLRCGQKI